MSFKPYCNDCQTWHTADEKCDAEIDVGRALDDEPDYPGQDCGRWSNGRLTQECSMAGTEECDFECPYRGKPQRHCE